MKDERKHVYRLANLIRARLVAQEEKRLADSCDEGQYIDTVLQRYRAICRKMGKAIERNWSFAAKLCQADAQQALEDLRDEIDAQIKRDNRSKRLTVVNLGNIVSELDQLKTEFHNWEFDPQEQDLSVQTETIELKGVRLGEFEIVLHLKTLAKPDPVSSYSIIALDANSATGREGVVHPHVSDMRLCPGDATVPIRSALECGLLCDFFLLVRSVLQTYNASSAYVQLEHWDGTCCSDCGDGISTEENNYCEFCDRDFCDSCSSYCRKCDRTGCLSCLETCPECEERVCSSCMKQCLDCGDPCCGDCLIEGLCPNCNDEKENNHESDDPENPDTVSAESEPAEEFAGIETDRQPDPALHPDRVGQAAVLLPPG